MPYENMGSHNGGYGNAAGANSPGNKANIGGSTSAGAGAKASAGTGSRGAGTGTSSGQSTGGSRTGARGPTGPQGQSRSSPGNAGQNAGGSRAGGVNISGGVNAGAGARASVGQNAGAGARGPIGGNGVARTSPAGSQGGNPGSVTRNSPSFGSFNPSYQSAPSGVHGPRISSIPGQQLMTNAATNFGLSLPMINGLVDNSKSQARLAPGEYGNILAASTNPAKAYPGAPFGLAGSVLSSPASKGYSPMSIDAALAAMQAPNTTNMAQNNMGAPITGGVDGAAGAGQFNELHMNAAPPGVQMAGGVQGLPGMGASAAANRNRIGASLGSDVNAGAGASVAGGLGTLGGLASQVMAGGVAAGAPATNGGPMGIPNYQAYENPGRSFAGIPQRPQQIAGSASGLAGAGQFNDMFANMGQPVNQQVAGLGGAADAGSIAGGQLGSMAQNVPQPASDTKTALTDTGGFDIGDMVPDVVKTGAKNIYDKVTSLTPGDVIPAVIRNMLNQPPGQYQGTNIDRGWHENMTGHGSNAGGSRPIMAATSGAQPAAPPPPPAQGGTVTPPPSLPPPWQYPQLMARGYLSRNLF